LKRKKGRKEEEGEKEEEGGVKRILLTQIYMLYITLETCIPPHLPVAA
jgi:hypothetical protein